MQQRSSRRRLFIALGTTLLILSAYAGINFYHNTRAELNAAATMCDLAEVRNAFIAFDAQHRRWPRTMEEVYSDEADKGGITRDCRDFLSGLPFRCVTQKDWYYRIGREKPYKVLVMLAEPYRTKLWPFGETRTMIVTISGVHNIVSSDIIDMSQNNAER
jgi:hypothetical protein